jgi:hypothetical protein
MNTSLAMSPAAARTLAAALLAGAELAEASPATAANQFSDQVYLDIHGDPDITLEVLAWDRFGYSNVNDTYASARVWL